MITVQDLMTVAENLCSGKCEADTRTVINRAYYASFHHCKSAAEKYGFRSHKGRSIHLDVITFLSAYNDVELRTAGQKLNDLRRLRTTADYDLSKSLGTYHGKRAIDTAKQILGIVM